MASVLSLSFFWFCLVFFTSHTVGCGHGDTLDIFPFLILAGLQTHNQDKIDVGGSCASRNGSSSESVIVPRQVEACKERLQPADASVLLSLCNSKSSVCVARLKPVNLHIFLCCSWHWAAKTSRRQDCGCPLYATGGAAGAGADPLGRELHVRRQGDDIAGWHPHVPLWDLLQALCGRRPQSH